ncbi:MAG: tyrosine-type recombinase/integrase [Oscillospiraceae bacterium]|nr:tyrosine-type recombinase/integrase [Oscillospiraceae bacterium]
MSVFKRKTSAGETSEYHYRFMVKGKKYIGVCEGCHDEVSAKDYELKIKQTASRLATQKSVKALVENFRDELSGGDVVFLKDAFRIYESKPRRRSMSPKQVASKESRFFDFVSFMNRNHRDVTEVRHVTRSHAEEYISYIRSNGRFKKDISYQKKRYKSKIKSLSPATQNVFLADLKSVFDSLKTQCGMEENPFSHIESVLEESETREAFSEDELELILKRAPEFVRNIFLVGFFTAFREGDISTLRWIDVLWDTGIIRRKLLKTGVVVEVPIMPPLASFLREQIGKDAEFVLPEHAAMYRENPSGISYRVKKFLENDLNIKTTKIVPGRSRAVSIKDVHSLRHTFCYFAGVAGIPLVIVQSIVGHMTPEMTSHYMAHADRKTKRAKMDLLPNFCAMIRSARRVNLIEQTKAILIDKIKTADDETISRVSAILLPPKKSKMLSLRNIAREKPKI